MTKIRAGSRNHYPQATKIRAGLRNHGKAGITAAPVSKASGVGGVGCGVEVAGRSYLALEALIRNLGFVVSGRYIKH